MIKDAVPITMPSAVRAKRTLLARNESMAMLTISLKSMVFCAVLVKGVCIGVLWHKNKSKSTYYGVTPPKTLEPQRTQRKRSPEGPCVGCLQDLREKILGRTAKRATPIDSPLK